MLHFNTDLYELKREIVSFSKKLTSFASKAHQKFVLDMIYGIFHSKSTLLSDISRSLLEDTKLSYTIDRLSTNLTSIDKETSDQLMHQYHQQVKKFLPKEPILLFDDSDISKPYGKKFEDLDRVIDGSSLKKETVNGYHVCEAVALTAKEKQPISLYSHIYSCTSDGFKSKNEYTIQSIDTARKVIGEKTKCTMVFDRGYDSVKIINKVDDRFVSEKTGKLEAGYTRFVLRLKENRNFIFKGKTKKVGDIVRNRKGKVKMTLWFDNQEKHDVYISHTRAILPNNKREYTIVIVYGLSEDKPMVLLTNDKMKSKEDVIRIVRCYFYRWRVEEYFRVKKQEYGFENMRVRSLQGMNQLNQILTFVLGKIGMLSEEIESRLLSMKIKVRSEAIKNRVCFWYYQIARGMQKILMHAKVGVKEYQRIEKRRRWGQLQFKLEYIE